MLGGVRDNFQSCGFQKEHPPEALVCPLSKPITGKLGELLTPRMASFHQQIKVRKEFNSLPSK